MSLILGTRDVRVDFPGTRALDQVSLELHREEVHAVVGANGSGKTTLLSVLCGLLAPTQGGLYDADGPVHFRSPAEALRFGVALVAQEPQLAVTMSCWENLLLGRPTRYGLTLGRRRGDAARRTLKRALPHIDPSNPAGALRKADRAIVALLAALARRPRVLALDEPTAVLGESGVEVVASAVSEIRSDGGTVVLVSHRLRDIMALATRVAVLVDGRLTYEGAASDLTADGLVTSLMHGRAEPEETPVLPEAPARRDDGRTVLSIAGLRAADGLEVERLDVRAGEIVGLAGLGGSGRTRLLRVAAGASNVTSGEISVEGRPLAQDPQRARRRGVAYVPEDRQREAIFPTLTVARNLSVGELALKRLMRGASRRDETSLAADLIARFKIRTAGTRAAVTSLSGGNLQRVILARALAHRPVLLIADEPTHGVDSHGRLGIHAILKAFSDAGGAILLASSDFDELLTLCTRIVVMRDGRALADVAPAAVDYRTLVSLASGAQSTVTESSAGTS